MYIQNYKVDELFVHLKWLNIKCNVKYFCNI